ncbi:MAG: hypothetical protein GC182_13350 [Rhodopseudomonas sp.]|nr:hypothetical protein [Rhodopseudomonas sp.]
MTLAFRLLILLIVLSPLFLANDSLLVGGILTGYVGVLMLIVARAMRPGEAAFFVGLIRPLVILGLIPAVWLVLQCIPMPFDGLRHPIWASAETALGHTLWGSISIGPGDTLLALARYLTALGLLLVTTAVSIDRLRAELILLSLTCVTSLLAVLLIAHNLGGFVFLGEISSIGPRAAISAAIIFGAVLSCASAVYAIERFETRGGRAEFNRSQFVIVIAMAVVALIVNLLAVALFASIPATFAALSGVGTFVLIIGFRRIGLGPGMGIMLAVIAVAVPLSLIGHDLLTGPHDLSLRFATDAPSALIDRTQRIVLDSSWTGSGAGTFGDLLPIYQDTSRPTIAAIAPTTMSGWLIELGRPAMILAILAALAAIARLIYGALQRGRDSFFTATGASCAVALTLEAFCDASLSTSTAIVLAMTILGLAVAQSVSRTARQSY